MRKLLNSIAVVVVAIAASGVISAGWAGSAGAAGNPPWEPDSNSVGGLLFFNAAGQQVTGGNLTDSPIAAYVQGQGTPRVGDTKATLFGYLPISGQVPGQWSGEALTLATTYPNPSAPAGLGSSSLPLVTGASGNETIAELETDFPNLDTSNDGYAGMYELRLKTSGPGRGPTGEYDSADIEISGSTWSVVYPAITLTSTTTTLTTVQSSPQFAGTSVELDANVSPAAPGTVQFEDNGVDIGSPVAVDGDGDASIDTSSLATGDDTLSADFTPAAFSVDSGSSGSTPFTINLNPTTTDLQASPPSPETAAAPVQLTATVSPSAATGTVQFEVGNADIGSPVTVNDGVASTSTSSLPVGDDSLSAVFTPDDGSIYAGSTGLASYTIELDPTTTTLTTVQASPQDAGVSVELDATVSPSAASGSVQFEVGDTPIGSPVTVDDGVASTTTSSLPVGYDSLSAVFTPDGGSIYAGSTGDDSFTIQLIPTETALQTTPASQQDLGKSVSIEATVTPATSGSVQFAQGSTDIGTPVTVVTGTASIATTSLPLGNDSLSAVFTPSPSSNYAGSSGDGSILIITVPGAPGSVSAVPSSGSISVAWTPPGSNGGSTITGYTATASTQFTSKSCTSATSPCTITGLTASAAYSISVVATNAAGSGAKTSLAYTIYPVASSTLRVEVPSVVVETNVAFRVLAYGVAPGTKVALEIDGTKSSCTTNAARQCTAAGKVSKTGVFTVSATAGASSDAAKFYAPDITVAKTVKKGQKFDVSIRSAPPHTSVSVTTSDHRSFSTTTSGSGAGSVKIAALSVGTLKVTVTIDGTSFPPTIVKVTS